MKAANDNAPSGIVTLTTPQGLFRFDLTPLDGIPMDEDPEEVQDRILEEMWADRDAARDRRRRERRLAAMKAYFERALEGIPQDEDPEEVSHHHAIKGLDEALAAIEAREKAAQKPK